MKVNPVTGQPEVERLDAIKQAAHQALMAEGHALATDLATDPGPKHLQDLLDDYQRFHDQLTAGPTFMGGKVPVETLMAKMDYIQTRIREWGLKIEFGRRARAQLERALPKGLMHGGPGQPD